MKFSSFVYAFAFLAAFAPHAAHAQESSPLIPPDSKITLPLLPAPSEVQEIVPPSALSAPVRFKKKTDEVRGLWVVRDEIHNREQVRRLVRLAKIYRFNTLFVQVRGRGDAYYASPLEPLAEELNGKSEFDPLTAVVEEGHRAGLQIHAWMNVFLVWHKTRKPYSSQHIVNRHPEWLVRDRQNYVLWGTHAETEGAFLNPLYKGVRIHLRNVYSDVATRYAVDGIHLDYVRFPSNDFSFSDDDISAFREWALPRVSPILSAYADGRARLGSRCAWAYVFPKEWHEWRRSLITQAVREIAQGVRAARPEAALTAAVFPVYKIAANDKGQAWHEWLAEGLLDGVALMAYSTSTEAVAAQVRDAVQNSSGRIVVAGLGAWRVPPRSAIAKAKAARALGAEGINFFSYGEMTRSGRNGAYLAELCGALFPTTAKTPEWRRSVEIAWLSFP